MLGKCGFNAHDSLLCSALCGVFELYGQVHGVTTHFERGPGHHHTDAAELRPPVKVTVGVGLVNGAPQLRVDIRQPSTRHNRQRRRRARTQCDLSQAPGRGVTMSL